METTIDSNGLGGFQTRQDRILCIRSQINRSSEELDRINEKLGAKDTPLEEWETKEGQSDLMNILGCY